MEPSGTLASDPPRPADSAARPQTLDRSEGGGGRRRGRLIRLASTVLLLIGLGLVSDVATIVLWQEPVSALYARVQQNRLAGQLAREENTAPSAGERHALDHLRTNRQRIALLARTLKRTAPRGAGVGRLRIPSLGVSYLLVKGADTESLKKGPGIYSQTPFPGVPGKTTAVAGHRTTYLAPFRNVDRLRPGQTIRVQMPYGDFTYAVEKTSIVDPTDFSVIRPVGYQRLVLSACDPPFSAAKRIIIFARLVHTGILGRAFNRAAAAPTPSSGPGVAVLLLVAFGVLVAVPLAVYNLAVRLTRRRRRR